MSAPFRLYNSFSRTMEDFTPIEEGKVRLYVCGMTVYDNAHIGHARAMVVFDAFVRYFRYRNWDVNPVRNFTDVDDKIIRRAAEQGMEPMELAEKYIRHFQRDAENLGLIEPDSEPRVSTSIPDIHRTDSNTGRQRTCLPIRRFCMVQCSFLQILWRSVWSKGRCTPVCRQRPWEKAPCRFCAVESGQTRRAILGVAVGSWSTWLAH